MRYSTSKEVDKIVRKYVSSRWVFKRGKKHGLLYPPNCGLFVVVPSSPSDSHVGFIIHQEIERLKKRVFTLNEF